MNRLHPITVVGQILQYGLFGLGLPVFLIGLGSLFVGLDTLMPLLPLFQVGALIGAVHGILAYYAFTYEVTGDTLVISKGWLLRQDRSIPIESIQHAYRRQKPWQSACHLSTVTVETANQSERDIVFRYLSTERAEQLLAATQHGSASNESNTEDDEHVWLRYTLGWRRLAVLAVSIWLPGSALLVLLSFPFVGSQITSVALEVVDTTPLLGDVPELLVFGLALVLLATTVSILLILNRFYGHTVVGSGELIQYRRGLLTTATGQFRRQDVQTVSVGDTPLLRATGLAKVSVELAEGASTSRGTQTVVLFPVVDATEITSYVELLDPAFEAEQQAPINRPSPVSRRRYLGRYLIVALGLGVLSAVLWNGFSAIAALVAGGLLAYVASRYKWRYRGYRLSPAFVTTRDGFWHRQTRVTRIEKLQSVWVTAGPSQRRFGLETVTVDTASSAALFDRPPQIHDIPEGDGTVLRNKLLSAYSQDN
ncbi:MAG: PH domain-containing protein [Halapricum sp.]